MESLLGFPRQVLFQYILMFILHFQLRPFIFHRLSLSTAIAKRASKCSFRYFYTLIKLANLMSMLCGCGNISDVVPLYLSMSHDFNREAIAARFGEILCAIQSKQNDE